MLPNEESISLSINMDATKVALANSNHKNAISTTGEEMQVTKYGYGRGSPTVGKRKTNTMKKTKSHRKLSMENSGTRVITTTGTEKTKSESISRSSTPVPQQNASSPKPLKSAMKKSVSNNTTDIAHTGTIENSKNNGSPTIRRRANITFSEKARVKRINSTRSLTTKPESLWFQNEELKLIRAKATEIIDRIERGNWSEKKYCTRGLEHLIGKEKQSRQIRRNQAVDSVLRAQDLQKVKGLSYFGDNQVSTSYMNSSIESQQEAARRACCDAVEAEKYLKIARKRYRRSSM